MSKQCLAFICRKFDVKKNIFFALSLFSFFATALFAEVTVVNPVPGNFANAQTLVIESNADEEIYYSFSGADPLSSGFAYDGPVLLDVVGNIELRVAVISKDLKQSEIKISYSVTPAVVQNAEHASFFSALERESVFEYVAGEKISVPFSLNYAFGENRNLSLFERGKEISISREATNEQFVPISFSDGQSEWRYVIHVAPAQAGILSRRKVPFEVVDWTHLVFTDPKMIYSLDGSWWYSSRDEVTLDRSVVNTVYFQSADFSHENPVTKIVLPPKPALEVSRLYGGAVKVSVHENPSTNNSETHSQFEYQISSSPLAKQRVVSDGLYSEVLLDVFEGDKIEDRIPFDIFFDGVFQGTLFAFIELNRSAPNVPAIRLSTENYYSRENVTVSASVAKNLKLFAGISDAIEIPLTFEMPNPAALNFSEPIFMPYDGKEITLFADTEKILAYKISFYSEDSLGVKSATVSRTVIVDKYNFYVDASSKNAEEDGTPFAPFKDLSQISKIANSNEFSRFVIKGEAQMGSGEVSLASNVEFIGMNDAKIVFPETCAILMKNAGFFARDITMEKILKNASSKIPRASAKALTNMFVFENSAATFNNCEIVSNFSGDGIVFNLSHSALSLEKTVVANTAQGYSSVLNALGSNVKIFGSRFLCVSDTAVCVSVNGGTFELRETFLQSSARMARIAEFLGASVVLEKNSFSAQGSRLASNEELIYKNSQTKILKDFGNVFQ